MSATHYYKVGQYEIWKACLQSYPCKHLVISDDKKFKHQINGYEIFCILRTDGLSHPHFDVYKKDVENREEMNKNNHSNYMLKLEKEIRENANKIN